ncbi:MAG: hypothetical protein U0T82_16320 [Bacteroidales bacterium]
MNVKKIVTWFGIIGSVASIVSLIYIFVPLKKNIELLVLTNNIEKLTQGYENKEPELKVEYSYKGTSVDNLWKYNVRFINNSQKTLIGISNQKNIITECLSFIVNDDLRILDNKNILSQFNHNIEVDSSGIKIFFEQWRPTEYLDYVFYVKANNNNPNKRLFDQPEFRQIVDGDIVFEVEKKGSEIKRITQILPLQFRQAMYVISLIFKALFIIIITISVFLLIPSFYKTNKWYKENNISFIRFIKETFHDKKELQDKYIEKPKDLPENLWFKFDGQKYPNVSVDIEIRKIYQFIILLMILVIIDFSLINTFIDLIYFFP